MCAEYLKNDICTLKPLFKFNPNIKKNIIACSFFKMNSHYKDFSLYVEGLEKLYHHVQKRMQGYHLRTFIDSNIYNDKKIMNRLNKLHRMEIVLFECDQYKKGNYHMGLFASMVRFFPMFDFPNNDADRVIISDIDDIVMNNLVKYMDKLKKDNVDSELYFIKLGNINKNIYYKYPMNYHDTLSPYAIAQMIASYKKMDHKVIMDYMQMVKENKNGIKFSYYEVNETNKSKFDKEYNNFIYGVDEYFINNILITYLVEEKLPFSTNTKYEVYGGIFYWLRSIKNKMFSLNEKNTEELKELISKLLQTIGKTFNNNVSLYDNYQVVDNEIYGKKDSIILFELYKLILESYFDKKYNFVFTDDLYSMILTQEHFGLYEFDKISFFNSTNQDWFSSKKMFSQEQMDKLYIILNDIHKKKQSCEGNK